MAVMARETWTDERLGDLNQRVDEGFKETRAEFRAVRSEMQTEFQAVRAEMKGEFQAVRAEMKAEFQAVRAEMKAEFRAVRAEMKGEFQALRTEMGEVRAEINALARVVAQLAYGLIGTLLVGFLGIAATLVVKL